MRFFATLAFLALALALVSITVAELRSHIETSESIQIPIGWKRISNAPVTQSARQIKLIFAVKRSNVDRLDQVFWEVSDPKHENYGKHLSLDEMTALIAPSAEAKNAIMSFLQSNGVTEITSTRIGDYVKATVSVPMAAHLLDIKFHSYIHASGISFDAAVGPYSLPAEVAQHIDLVTGAVGFPDIETKTTLSSDIINADVQINPTVIRARYNIDTVGSNPKNLQAVAEFQGQYYSPTDFKDFWTQFITFAPFKDIAQVVGDNVVTKPGMEASLDVEYLAGTAPGIPIYFYGMKQFNFWNDLVSWAGELASESNPPFVHSVSYGSQGNYPTNSYQDRLNQDFQVLGTRGLSIVFASGDDGAGCQGGVSSETCDCTFFPSFPATSPYVLTVGATRFLSGNSGTEGAVQTFGSGGGFSDYFGIPSYQATNVAAYLKSGVSMPEACAFNNTGRSTPDVAALGDTRFIIINGGRKSSIGGTSASTPVFSGVLTLLNDIRLTNGKSTLGFVNPWIYQVAASNPSAFNDITVGDNVNARCCKSGALSGFDCATGYDPVTGLGTPNFAVLKTLV